MQSLLLYDVCHINIHHTDFGRKDQLVIVRDIISGRTQTVSVQHRPHDISVGEQDGCRAIPWLHHGRIVLIEISLLPAHALVILPWLRNQDHHRQRQRHPAHHKKFQRVVQPRGIRSIRIHHRRQLDHLIPQIIGLHLFLPGQHLIRIPPDGVNLTVMDNVAVRMRFLPAWHCVCGEPGMYQRDGRLIIRVMQVSIEVAELPHQEHTFIYDRPAAQGYYIGEIIGLLENPPHDIEAAPALG